MIKRISIISIETTAKLGENACVGMFIWYKNQFPVLSSILKFSCDE